MFRSYIKVILSYLKLSYFILNLCIAEQLFTPHISVVYFISSQIRQLLIKHARMMSWLCKRIGSVESWLCAGQCSAGMGRAGFQVQARTYIHCSLQSEILKLHVLALSKMSVYLLRVICQVVFKRIKRILQLNFLSAMGRL